MTLTEGHDPDSLVRAEGADGFRRRISGSVVLSDYFFQHLLTDNSLASLEGKAALIHSAQPLLGRLPAGNLQRMMSARLADLTGIDGAGGKKSATLTRNSNRRNPSNLRPSLVRTILALLVRHPGLIRFLDEESRRLLCANERLQPFPEKLFAVLESHPELSLGGILEEFRGSDQESPVLALANWAENIPEERAEQVFRDALNRYRDGAQDRKLALLLDRLKIGGLAPAEREELENLLRRR